MNNPKTLADLDALLNKDGERRLLRFLNEISASTVKEFRGWIGAATEENLKAAAEVLNHQKDRAFELWWRKNFGNLAVPHQTNQLDPNHHTSRRRRSKSRERFNPVGKSLIVGLICCGFGILLFMLPENPSNVASLMAWGSLLLGGFLVLRGWGD